MWLGCQSPKGLLSHSLLSGTTAFLELRAGAAGPMEILRTLGAAVSLSLGHPWRLQPRVLGSWHGHNPSPAGHEGTLTILLTVEVLWAPASSSWLGLRLEARWVS